MRLWLVKFSLVWIITLSGLNLIARAVGIAKPPNPALNGFFDQCSDQPRPCWHGILPGITTKETARAMLAEMGYTGHDSASGFLMDYHTTEENVPQCIFIGYSAGGDEGKIASLELGCSTLTVGEVSGVLGFPEALRFDRLLSSLSVGYVQPETGFITNVTLGAKDISAFTPADFISLTRAGQHGDGAAGWRGFAPVWRYCQMQPDYFGCKR
jgi:hypothetical protein